MEECGLEREMGRELSWWLWFGSGAFVCRVPEIADNDSHVSSEIISISCQAAKGSICRRRFCGPGS